MKSICALVLCASTALLSFAPLAAHEHAAGPGYLLKSEHEHNTTYQECREFPPCSISSATRSKVILSSAALLRSGTVEEAIQCKHVHQFDILLAHTLHLGPCVCCRNCAQASRSRWGGSSMGGNHVQQEASWGLISAVPQHLLDWWSMPDVYTVSPGLLRLTPVCAGVRHFHEL